jgi:hypothetical protein
MTENEFGAFYACAYHRSLQGKGAVAFAVWGYVISHAYPMVNPDGEGKIGAVHLNSGEVAYLIGCGKLEVDAAIELFCAPDPDSNSKQKEGRKLVKIKQFLYEVVNLMEYRNRKSNSPEAKANREKQERFRGKQEAVAAECSSAWHVAHGICLPEAWQNESTLRVLRIWLDYKAERKQAYGKTALRVALGAWPDEFTQEEFSMAVRFSIKNGYAGLVLPEVRETKMEEYTGPNLG